MVKKIDHTLQAKKDRKRFLRLKKNITPYELGWLVALLEGEGCFYYERTQAVALLSTDFDVVETYERITRKIIGHVIHIVHDPRPAQVKDIYRIKLHGEDARKLLHVVVEHMHVRRRCRIWQILNGHKEKKNRDAIKKSGLDINSIIESIKRRKEVTEQ